MQVDEAAAKLKMEITSKPVQLDEIDRKILQLEMEKLSMEKAAPTDKGAAPRLAVINEQLTKLKVCYNLFANHTGGVFADRCSNILSLWGL